jgi:putative N-acetylmannosamine-6-phosphate epimerase
MSARKRIRRERLSPGAILARLRGHLIVSCQASPESPLHRPEIIAALALCAERGGAGGVRVDGPANIAAVRRAVSVPIIGIYKIRGSSPVYITPTLEAARAVADAGAHVVAVQATRERETAEAPLRDLIGRIHDEYGLPVMADVSTLAEGLAAAAAGADLVATTLAGYTPHSRHIPGPDLDLVRDLAGQSPVPVVAEGRITTPQEARAARLAGAWAVVVGRAITMPDAITRRFARALADADAGAADAR